MNLSGSKTELNLLRTFSGESRARTKYNIYGEMARAEGYYCIGHIFDETASNEFAHAREAFCKYLKMMNTTEENLLDAAIGEKEEVEQSYRDFEETAKKEGFHEIAHFFNDLREVEEKHKEKFMKLYQEIKSKTLYCSNTEKMWKCLNCGYIYTGKEVPDKCPLCKYPRGYFEMYCNCEKK